MHRREFLKAAAFGSAGLAVARLGGPRTADANTAEPAWRIFEITTHVEVANPSGAARAWVPLPLIPDTDYQKSLGQNWTGNARNAQVYRDAKYGAGILVAEWAASGTSPVLDVTARFATRDRSIDLTKPGTAAPVDKATLAPYTSGSRFIPIDGVVASTSREVTNGAGSDLEKARAIYEWICDNTFRDPKVRGCGLGDIRALLETGNLGGKCADLNALFVGLARSAGLAARDVYGIRVADSAEFKCLGKSGDVTKAQHCRAEFYLPTHGWVPVDPADVRKVVLEEDGGLPVDHPTVKRARAKLFGAWEMNWLGYNYAADLKLPQSSGDPVPFLMYPQAEAAGARRDSLDPESFRYRITSRQIS